MRILIIGAGEVGSYLARHLVEENHNVTVIDASEERVRKLEEQIDLRGVVGSGSDVSTLELAEAGRNDLVLATSSSDEINMLAVLFSKRLGARRGVARISATQALSEHLGFYRDQMEIDLVINPALRTASAATAAITGGAQGIAEFGFGSVQCREFEVHAGSSFTRKPLKDLKLPGALIVALLRRGEVIIPSGNDVINVDDRIVVIYRREALGHIRKGVGEQNTTARSIFIVGGGRIARAIALYFDHPRYHVKLFEDDKRRAWQLAEELEHVKVIDSSGVDIDVLRGEYLEQADALVAATDSDERDLMLAALAKEVGVKRTVAIVDQPQYTELGRLLDLTATLSPRILAANQILTFIRAGNINRVALIAEGQAEVLEFQAREGFPLLGKPLSELDLPRGIIIAALLRGTKPLIPKGDDSIQAGDSVIAFSLTERVGYLTKLLQDRAAGAGQAADVDDWAGEQTAAAHDPAFEQEQP